MSAGREGVTLVLSGPRGYSGPVLAETGVPPWSGLGCSQPGLEYPLAKTWVPLARTWIPAYPNLGTPIIGTGYRRERAWDKRLGKPQVWTDKQSENITFPRTTYAGGNTKVLLRVPEEVYHPRRNDSKPSHVLSRGRGEGSVGFRTEG